MLPWASLHATETAVFRVTARVVEFCDVTTTDLARDAVQSGTPLLRATCTPDTSYFIGVTKGATTNQQNGVSGARASNHPLYLDSALRASGNMLTVTGVGTGEPVDHTVFGGVPAAKVIAPVYYGDTVSVRVYY